MPDELALLIRAGHPVISIETTDERAAERLVREAADRLGRPLYVWSVTGGLRSGFAPAGSGPLVPAGKLGPTLAHVEAQTDPAVYLLRDAAPHAKDAFVHRMFRDCIAASAKSGATVVLVDSQPLPDEFRPLAVRYELGWPTAEELKEVVKETFRSCRAKSEEQIRGSLTGAELEQLVQSLRGLSRCDAARVISSAIYKDHALTAEDLPQVVEAKRKLLGGVGCLESIAADVGPGDIGGLTNLKAWLAKRRGGFTPEAERFGLEPPRGVLMLGVPGCGKSLAAKVVAADWTMPLLRLDPGVLYQKFVGASEGRLREALRQAEATAPCVLWIDEIEKAFASASADSADGGLSQRMFGTLLSWMQDHRHPIFLIATANDVSKLPPELMRKGRFDEVFFIDLPDAESRAQILSIHLRRRGRDPRAFDLAGLAAASDGFTGSELEQAVVSALFAAFGERSASGGKPELADRHLAAEIAATRPLSTLMAEKIAALRSWAEGRCVPAD